MIVLVLYFCLCPFDEDDDDDDDDDDDEGDVDVISRPLATMLLTMPLTLLKPTSLFVVGVVEVVVDAPVVVVDEGVVPFRRRTTTKGSERPLESFGAKSLPALTLTISVPELSASFWRTTERVSEHRSFVVER